MNKNLIKLILMAVALGMGVSTLVLNVLGNITVNTAVTLLSIAVICLAISKLQEK
ncbi:hypothetical protein [Sporosarcina limicola]|uniref:Uncharacterized protein n=1 Tax=Sporosarcina limicola TaxID=34101 RepID=A0A927MLM7_9BACL|nr:hypothetical protein [Sporosarcina limicola]MBE1556221.1 hypothetical protein [Sporosarcina limicola]